MILMIFLNIFLFSLSINNNKAINNIKNNNDLYKKLTDLDNKIKEIENNKITDLNNKIKVINETMDNNFKSINIQYITTNITNTKNISCPDTIN